MNGRRRSAVVVVGLAACDNPVRPDGAATNVSPPAASVTAEERFAVRTLGTLGGSLSIGLGINERTEVTGFADLPSGDLPAFLWAPGRGTRSPGTLGSASSFGIIVNDRTEVVGHSAIRPDSDVQHAFLWTKERGMRDLGTLGGRFSAAYSISQNGEVVGESETARRDTVAFLWTARGGMRTLRGLHGAGADAATAGGGLRGQAAAALCALGRNAGARSRLLIATTRACLAR